MTDLIKRDDALALVEQWFDTDNHLYSIILNDITNLPAVDPVVIHQVDPAAIRKAAMLDAGYDTPAIRNAALREAMALPKYAPTNYGAMSPAERGCWVHTGRILALIGETK